MRLTYQSHNVSESPGFRIISEAATTPVTNGNVDDDHNISFYLDIVYYCIGILGIIGNTFVVVIMMMSRRLRRRSANLIITNQSVIDGTACVFLIAIAADKSAVRNEIMCDLWFTKMPLWSLLVTSTYNLILLTLDRYLAIAWPLRHRVSFSSRKVIIFLLLPWIFGTTFNVAYIIPTTVYVTRNDSNGPGYCDKFTKWPSDDFQFGFAVVIVLVQYIIPISLQIAFYSLIVYNIRKRLRGSPTSGRSNLEALVCHGTPVVWSRAQRNSVKTAFIVSLCFVLCWTVDQFFFCKYFLTGAENYNDNFFEYTLVIVTANCSVNPVIYCLQYESFRQEATKMLCKRVLSDTQLAKNDEEKPWLQKTKNIFYISYRDAWAYEEKFCRKSWNVAETKHAFYYYMIYENL